MADYTETKPVQGIAQYPINVVDTKWGRLEPLISVKLLRENYLFGIPLVSRIPQIVDGKKVFAEMSDEYLANQIHRMVSEAELELGLAIMPYQVEERHPFDRNPYMQGGYFKLKQRPIASLEKLAVSDPTNQVLWDLPLQWIDVGYMHLGQINVLPFNLASANFTVNALPAPNSPASANTLFWLMGTQWVDWVAGYWQVFYTVGWKDGLVPVIINDFIGNMVALEILQLLSATYVFNTPHSLSLDGMSQSASPLGPQLWQGRIQQLQETLAKNREKLRKIFGAKIFTSVI